MKVIFYNCLHVPLHLIGSQVTFCGLTPIIQPELKEATCYGKIKGSPSEILNFILIKCDHPPKGRYIVVSYSFFLYGEMLDKVGLEILLNCVKVKNHVK